MKFTLANKIALFSLLIAFLTLLCMVFDINTKQTTNAYAESSEQNKNTNQSSKSTVIMGNITSGTNSPLIMDGNVTINYKVGDEEKVVQLPILDIRVPRNNEKSELDSDGPSISDINKILISYFDELNKLNDEFVYIRFHTYVGAGFGINDLTKHDDYPRAGVVFELRYYVDGFGGNLNKYKYGYALELDDWRNEWGGARRSIILFPADANPFFDVNYSKSMFFEGFAKIRVSGLQENQFIEIVPSEPIGYLQKAYDYARENIESFPNKKWGF